MNRRSLLLGSVVASVAGVLGVKAKAAPVVKTTHCDPIVDSVFTLTLTQQVIPEALQFKRGDGGGMVYIPLF